jgi:hypothetical protein
MIESEIQNASPNSHDEHRACVPEKNRRGTPLLSAAASHHHAFPNKTLQPNPAQSPACIQLYAGSIPVNSQENGGDFRE